LKKHRGYAFNQCEGEGVQETIIRAERKNDARAKAELAEIKDILEKDVFEST